MKVLLIITLLMACTSIFFSEFAIAQGSEPVKIADPFTWAKTSPPDWLRGALFAALGFVGALVTIFGLVGGAVPGTAGQARIDSDRARLERLSKRLEDLISESKPDSDTIGAVETTVNNLRDDLRSETWRQFAIATIIYALLGAFFSAFLAQDFIQALVIGAGWTGVLGTLGLKKDFSERKATKDAALEKALERAKKAEETAGGTREKSLRDSLPKESLAELERDVRAAQRL